MVWMMILPVLYQRNRTGDPALSSTHTDDWYDGSYRVEGTVLNQRLCLFHGYDVVSVCVRHLLPANSPPPEE